MAVAATLELGHIGQIYGEQEPFFEAPILPLGIYADTAVDHIVHFETEIAQQPTDFTDSVRPPESEIYGRSLSTIHRLGAFMVDRVVSEVVHSPEADQARVEFYTSVEEGFGTDSELGGGLEVRDFVTRPVLGGKVMARDYKTAVSDMTEAGLLCAEEKAKVETASGDYRFVPQLVRSKWDHENALLVDAMARGETDYNTRIVISPFPEEAAAESGDKYWQDIGYVPQLKRGFVQLYHADSDGLVSGSLSFEGSNKEKLREVFSRHGIEIPEKERTDNWLQYAVTGTLSENDAKALALEIADEAASPIHKEQAHTKKTNTVDITTEHHVVMDTVFNESYIHACESLVRGYQTPGVRGIILQLADKAGSFNSRYRRALFKMRANENQYSDDDMVILHELLVYSTIEMMRALHLRKQNSNHNDATSQYVSIAPDAAYLQSLDQVAFQRELSGFGAEGARNNRTYSACGLSISAGSSTRSGDNESPQSAFGGNVDGEREGEDSDADCEFVSKVCPECGAKNVKTVVKKISGSRKRIEGACGCSKTFKG